MHIIAETLDDLAHDTLRVIKDRGHRITPTKGGATEVTGVLLELSNPRARLSLTESRGKLFSCLAEFCWYVGRRKDISFMEYYIREYRSHVEIDAVGDVVGAYGPRLFNDEGHEQWSVALQRLRGNPSSRKAVVVILHDADLTGEHSEAPCTCTLQMFARDHHLDMIANMRSNDVYKGLIHDAFSFTMLQEIAARSLGIELGTYKHFVGSLHLYDHDAEDADLFLQEGYQSTKGGMPPMPEGDPWPSINLLLSAEEKLRTAGVFEAELYRTLEPYWLDLIHLLRVFRYRKDRQVEKILSARSDISFSGYLPFVDAVLESMDVCTQSQRRARGMSMEGF